MAIDLEIAPAEPRTVSTRRERTGWYFYDWANSAFSTTVAGVFMGPYLTSVAKEAAGCAGSDTCSNKLDVLWFELLPGSLFPTVLSIAVVLNVVILPVIGAIADRSYHKRRLLGTAAFIGAGATVAMLTVTEGRYLLGSALIIIASMAFGASVVVYNSFLPQIATEETRDKVSSMGWALGYLGGGILLALNLVALVKLESTYGTGTVARWSIVSAGIWWAAFTLLPLRFLRDRPPIHLAEARGGWLTSGFVQLWDTLKHLRRYKLTLFFLLAYLVYNDGIQTVINMASTYGTEELKLAPTTIVITFLLVQFLAFFGALGLGRMAGSLGAKKTVLCSLVLWIGVVLVAYWVPAGSASMFMVLGALIGLVLGGSQALSRSLFSQLIPAGKEAEYFGFYEISDKGTSWLGTAFFALVFELTRGSYRLGVVSVIAFFVAGFALLLLVPVRKAIVAAGNRPPRLI